MTTVTRPPLRGDELLLTYREAAAQLRVSEKTFRRMVERGEIPTVRVGACPRIARADLESWILAERTRNGVPV